MRKITEKTKFLKSFRRSIIEIQREEKRSLVKSQVLLGKILKESISNRSLEASISPTKNKISKKMKEIFWRTRILRAFELILNENIARKELLENYKDEIEFINNYKGKIIEEKDLL